MEKIIDPAERRRVKREEMLQRYSERMRLPDISCAALNSNSPTMLETDMITGEEEDNAIISENQLSSTCNETATIKCRHASAFADYVEDTVNDKLEDSIVYANVYDIVSEEIYLHAYDISLKHFPSTTFGNHDDNNPISADKSEHIIHYFSGNIGRFVESHIGLTADLVDNAIMNSGITIDMISLLDIVSETIVGITTSMAIETIQNALVDVVTGSFHTRDFSNEFNWENALALLNVEANSAAVRINDSICLTVDDTITNILVDAFAKMCESIEIEEANAMKEIDNVAEKVADMKI